MAVVHCPWVPGHDHFSVVQAVARVAAAQTVMPGPDGFALPAGVAPRGGCPMPDPGGQDAAWGSLDNASMLPVLYTFRRCPYAMRARWAVYVAGVAVQQVEVNLRDKPAAMLAASPKGTVPVLVLPDGQVIDQSLDIMCWALAQHDPQGWLAPIANCLDEQLTLIGACEQQFKPHLDRYKYPNRFHAEWGHLTANAAAAERSFSAAQFGMALAFLRELTVRLARTGVFLGGARPALADFAIVPFVRQMARHEPERFARAVSPVLTGWLNLLLARPDFEAIMRKPGERADVH